jgi:hypothetical protein
MARVVGFAAEWTGWLVQMNGQVGSVLNGQVGCEVGVQMNGQVGWVRS